MIYRLGVDWGQIVQHIDVVIELPWTLHLEGGPVNHSWCMGVVSHSYGGLGGGRDGGGSW